ncbi:MAG TPA: class I SAM-dependent rRNA methyltransferase [Rhabdochlamydiaceae bacterium]|nr:class I SAM-dependent rRNA methyltransferase [Rhabdochlamydiaceae bacterium]
MLKKAVLKEGKERSLLKGHPWIFSGAISSLPQECEPGEILPVYSSSGQFLAQAYFHPTHSLIGRVISFNQKSIEEELKSRILDAFALRNRLFDLNRTNGFRLINGEGDGISGLVVDDYDGILVLQAHTCGIERLKPLIVSLLVQIVQPKAIYEKSTSQSRKEEGLEEKKELLYGTDFDEIEIRENGLKFLVAPKTGQKTGYFFDQREMRTFISSYSLGKKVLNCFAYTGGFGIYALAGGATQVDSIEICKNSTALATKITALNGLKNHHVIQEEVFEFIAKSPLDYDLIILDPPAFAKKRKDADAACAGYINLNQSVFAKMPPRSYLLTCSCSQHIDELLFKNLIFQSALRANRRVKILSCHRQALDHPVSLAHPEGAYLKSLFLYVE